MRALLLLTCSSVLCFGGTEVGSADPGPDAGTTDVQSSGSLALPVPEPATMLLAGLGGIAMLMFAIRRK